MWSVCNLFGVGIFQIGVGDHDVVDIVVDIFVGSIVRIFVNTYVWDFDQAGHWILAPWRRICYLEWFS